MFKQYMYDSLRNCLLLMVFIPCLVTVGVGKSSTGTPRLMQGPMIGAVSPTSISVWMRVSGEYDCALDYGLDPQLGDARQSETVTARMQDDFCVVVTLRGLQAGQYYYYRPLVDGKVPKYHESALPYRSRSAPAADQPTRFRMAFGSCARVQRHSVQNVWSAVESLQPAFFCWLGDNVYGDALDTRFLSEEYRRQRDVPAFQPIARSIPQLAIWDDHDYGLNNHDRTSPIKQEALRIFRNYWANPAYGSSSTPGVFFRYSYGGVDFFFLDGRFHRDPNDLPASANKTMLGAAQMAWLQNELRASTAPFKVLASGSGWSAAKGSGGDSWASFLDERNRLFEFIRSNNIGGVLLLSGDTHVGELNCIPWSDKGGYDMYDFVSSPLAQECTDSWLDRKPEIRMRSVYFGGPNFGLLEFDLGTEVPTLRYSLINAQGKVVRQPLVLTSRELQNGVKSWPRHIEEDERRRQGL